MDLPYLLSDKFKECNNVSFQRSLCLTTTTVAAPFRPDWRPRERRTQSPGLRHPIDYRRAWQDRTCTAIALTYARKRFWDKKVDLLISR